MNEIHVVVMNGLNNIVPFTNDPFKGLAELLAYDDENEED